MPALRLADLLEVVTFVDPAAGKRGEELKRTRARQAIVTVGQDTLGRIFCLQAHAARNTTERFMDLICQANEDWHPGRFGIEANGMQVLFGDQVYLQARQRGIHIPFEPVYQPTNVKKEWRIRTGLQPKIAHGLLFLAEEQDELRAEIQGFPNYPTLDLIDALETAIRLLPDRKPLSDRDDEVEAIAAYLRETGVKPHLIEQRVAELRQGLP